MKKTHTLSLGGSLFHIEEDAYQNLESYLQGIKAHFEGNEDREEIIRDVEARIAEKFLESGHTVISVGDVELVMDAMGTPSQFDGEEEVHSTSKHEPKIPKRLYRDKDNAIIAGVSAGLGHFFGVDPIIFRLIFGLSIFLGGTGIIVYVILWILVPKATTTSQKLSMKGTPVTVASVAELIREKVDEVNTPEHRSNARKLFEAPINGLKVLIGFIKSVLYPAVRVLLGSLILLASFFFAIGATFALSFALFGVSETIIQGPFLTLAQSSVAQGLAVALYVLAIIPIIIAAGVGLGMLMKRHFITVKVLIALSVLWWIALPVAGALGTKIGTQAAHILDNDPYYKRETTMDTFQPFTTLVVTGRQSVRIVEGNEYRVETRARAEDRARLVHTLDGNTLTLGETRSEKSTSCLFCGGEYVEITVTVPALSAVTVKNGSHVSGDVEGNTLLLTLDKNSSVSLDVNVSTLTVTAEDSSRAYLRGNAKKVSVTLGNSSRVEAEELVTEESSVQAVNRSQAFLYVTKQLDIIARNQSYIGFKGNPEVTEEVDASSNIHNSDAR